MSITPIIPGFHPDPSICRVGEDYYVITSSFEYLPGVPIFHSRDLVTWKLIGNVLDREDQLWLESSEGSSGIFAPTLRFHDGRFWMITTSINRVEDGHLIVWATDPSGPWSAPVYTSGAVGIDPDLFWDVDGTCYLTWSAFGHAAKIMQVQIDPETGALLSTPRPAWSGIGLAHPEAPHLYRRGDWYYTVLAEGGTERGHTVTIARSRSVDGPWLNDPANPILSHRSTAGPVQNTGHADLVETADGSWAMVYLAVRPTGPTPGYHLNGRETFLAAVRWEDDWPVVDEDAFEVPAWSADLDEYFTSPTLDPRWVGAGRHPHSFVTPIEQVDGGGVTIAAAGPQHRPFLGIRVENENWDARATVDAGSGRLVLRADDAHWVAVESQDGLIAARVVIGPVDQVLAEVEVSVSATVTLALRSTQPSAGLYGAPVADDLELGYLLDGEFQSMVTIDGRYLATEVAGGFTGRVVGVEPLPDREGAAVLRRFEYRAL